MKRRDTLTILHTDGSFPSVHDDDDDAGLAQRGVPPSHGIHSDIDAIV